jgi:hypothetical protein
MRVSLTFVLMTFMLCGRSTARFSFDHMLYHRGASLRWLQALQAAKGKMGTNSSCGGPGTPACTRGAGGRPRSSAGVRVLGSPRAHVQQWYSMGLLVRHRRMLMSGAVLASGQGLVNGGRGQSVEVAVIRRVGVGSINEQTGDLLTMFEAARTIF